MLLRLSRIIGASDQMSAMETRAIKSAEKRGDSATGHVARKCGAVERQTAVDQLAELLKRLDVLTLSVLVRQLDCRRRVGHVLRLTLECGFNARDQVGNLTP